VQLLKAAGCRVIGIDLDAGKLELARQLGADACLLRSKQVEELVAQLTGAAGVDAVVITAASETNDPLELAGAIARDRATVAVVGAVKLEVPRKLYYEKELQLRLSRSYGPGRYDAQYEEQGIDYPIGYVRWTERRNMQEFLRLVATKAVQLAPLVTHRFPIERAEQAYDVITGKTREAYLGVLLTYANERPPGGAVVTLRPLPKNATAQTAGFVSLGVIGAGNFARSVLLPRLAANAQVILHGIATATGRNAKAVGEQYGFGFCTTDYRELLKRAEINAVLIATRHNLHAQLTAEAVRAGKTVYVEKPLALTATELAEVRAAVANHAGRVMVGFNRRFSPLSLKLKQAFSHGAPLAISYRVNAGAVPPESWIQSEEGGGRIVGEVCHFVDYLQFLTDAEPVEVFAYANAAGADTLSIVVKLSDGSVGNINYFATGDRGLAKERVEVYGGGCAGVLDDFRALECWREGRKRATRRFRQEKGFAEGLAAFVEAARTDAAMPIAWRSLVLTTLATLRIEGALRSGRPAPVELFDEL
jgi:polar amino acid transport system substrate-binding protein